MHRNKKCIEVATEEFLKGRLVLLLQIERPLSISHVFGKQSVFYFIKLSALFFSPLMLYFIFNPSLLFLPVFAGEISLYHVSLFLTVFWPLHGEQCCAFYTIHILMVKWEFVIAFGNSAIMCLKQPLPFFLSCYVVGSCACRSWFLMNSKWNTGPIKFKLMQKVHDVRRNDWNKVSQNITEEFSWKWKWPVKKMTRYIFGNNTYQ